MVSVLPLASAVIGNSPILIPNGAHLSVAWSNTFENYKLILDSPVISFLRTLRQTFHRGHHHHGQAVLVTFSDKAASDILRTVMIIQLSCWSTRTNI